MKRRKAERVRRPLDTFMAGTLVVAALCATVPARALAADAWEALGPARIGAGFEQISRDAALKCDVRGGRAVCAVTSSGPVLFSGVLVARVEALFRESALERVNVSLATTQYEALHRVVTAHYGAGEDCSFLAIAGMAAEFVAGVFVWRVGTTSVVLRQYAGKIDRSALSYGTEESMADVVRKARAYPRGARRDL